MKTFYLKLEIKKDNLFTKKLKNKDFQKYQINKDLKSLNFKTNLFYICEKIALSSE